MKTYITLSLAAVLLLASQISSQAISLPASAGALKHDVAAILKDTTADGALYPVAQVPEPSTYALMGLGLLALVLVSLRKRTTGR